MNANLLLILRSGVKTVDEVTKTLQATVSFERWTGSDGYGAPTYLPAVPLKAIVDWKQKQVRTVSGVLSVSRASVMFLDIVALTAATPAGATTAGVSDEDKITLPDGTTGPILDMAGFIDAGTGHPIATEVFLG